MPLQCYTVFAVKVHIWECCLAYGPLALLLTPHVQQLALHGCVLSLHLCRLEAFDQASVSMKAYQLISFILASWHLFVTTGHFNSWHDGRPQRRKGHAAIN